MLRRLVERFQDRTELPIEIEEIRDALIDLGVQDKIIFSPEELDTGTLRGAYYQWCEHRAAYGEPVLTTLIVYPKNEDITWQRAICAKELVHVCDKQIVKTQTAEMVEELAQKVVGPFETRTATPADLMATVDKLAQYQGLNLLFPVAARRLARAKIAAGERSYAEIAQWACIPENYARLLLEESWDALNELLTAIGNGDHH
jgi:hypothetical protein